MRAHGQSLADDETTQVEDIDEVSGWQVEELPAGVAPKLGLRPAVSWDEAQTCVQAAVPKPLPLPRDVTPLLTRGSRPAPPAPAPNQPGLALANPSTATLRSKELHSAAQNDLENLDRIAAMMNLKLAMALDPQNMEVRRLLLEVVKETSGASLPRLKDPTAQMHVEAGCAAELKSSVDVAIRSFEIALKLCEEPAVMRRLAILLIKKRSYPRARALLERAVALAPSDPIYAASLAKVIARSEELPPQVAPRGARARPPVRKPGLFGSLLARARRA